MERANGSRGVERGGPASATRLGDGVQAAERFFLLVAKHSRQAPDASVAAARLLPRSSPIERRCPLHHSRQIPNTQSPAHAGELRCRLSRRPPLRADPRDHEC